ncbi:helix-turn-helix transcriptional regulator [bacterium]|jgi:hypothetical protein|nr:helix-turn-helix transcriptional regulator [bacterium]
MNLDDKKTALKVASERRRDFIDGKTSSQETGIDIFRESINSLHSIDWPLSKISIALGLNERLLNKILAGSRSLTSKHLMKYISKLEKIDADGFNLQKESDGNADSALIDSYKIKDVTEGSNNEELRIAAVALKNLRLDHKLSQKQLAIKTNQEQSFISKLEKGSVPIDLDLSKKFANIFGIDHRVFL